MAVIQIKFQEFLRTGVSIHEEARDVIHSIFAHLGTLLAWFY